MDTPDNGVSVLEGEGPLVQATSDYLAGRLSREDFAAAQSRYALDYGAATLAVTRSLTERQSRKDGPGSEHASESAQRRP